MLGILGVHLLALIAFGSWTVYKAVMPKDPTFEEPPPMEKIERVQLEYKVRMQEQQRKSQRPKQKLQVKQISEMQMPEMDIQVPNINSSTGVGRVGNGNFGDLGDGGGLSLGGVSVDLFDIKAKGEKFLFIVDVRRDLLQDKKGGIPTYNVIKEDVIGLIEDLPSGVLFNMILFDKFGLEVWQPQLVPATAENKEAFANWIRPVNSSINQTGLRKKNYRPTAYDQPMAKRILTHGSQGNSVFMATVAGLEQRPDAIFILSDGMPSFEKIVERNKKSPEQRAKIQEAYLKKIENLGFESESAYRKARAASSREVSRRISDYKKKENAARAKKGIPPRVYTKSESKRLRDKMESDVRKSFDGYVPGVSKGDTNEYEGLPEREVTGWIEQLQRLFYDQNQDERPQVNAIVFKGKDESVSEDQEDVIDDFVDEFDGDYRILIGLGQIDSGSVSK